MGNKIGRGWQKMVCVDGWGTYIREAWVMKMEVL